MSVLRARRGRMPRHERRGMRIVPRGTRPPLHVPRGARDVLGVSGVERKQGRRGLDRTPTLLFTPLLLYMLFEP